MKCRDIDNLLGRSEKFNGKGSLEAQESIDIV